MANEFRRFHIGDIATVATDFTCTPGGWASIRRLLCHVVNRQLLPFQLPEAVMLVKPLLWDTFDWLTQLDVPDPDTATEESARTWIMEQAARFGTSHLVPRLPEGTWVDRDPIEELKSKMRPGAQVHTVLDMGGRYAVLDNLKPGDIRNPPFDPED
jgi:hypothetical protein